MSKKKRSYEEILEDIRNYKPKMTEGDTREVFYAKMMGAIEKKEDKRRHNLARS